VPLVTIKSMLLLCSTHKLPALSVPAIGPVPSSVYSLTSSDSCAHLSQSPSPFSHFPGYCSISLWTTGCAVLPCSKSHAAAFFTTVRFHYPILRTIPIPLNPTIIPHIRNLLLHLFSLFYRSFLHTRDGNHRQKKRDFSSPPA